MSDCIYVIKGGTAFVKLEAEEYETEDEFQSLLEQFPSLLSGELISPEEPLRFLLVGREMPVPDREDGSGRWSLDHLFVDQDGMPTLVEVKRQSDTRLRREVVGQMLDYAANAAVYWPAELLQQKFAETSLKKGVDTTTELREFTGDPSALEATFWQGVESRLANGDMRLIFFADRVGTELQRIVEFMNDEMQHTEVLALEVRRYTGEDLSTHIPRVIGLSASAGLSKAKGASPRRKWTEEIFVAELGRLPTRTSTAIQKVLSFSKNPGWDRRFGTGTVDGSLNLLRPSIATQALITVWTTGKMTLQLGSFQGSGSTKDKCEKLRQGVARFGQANFGLEVPSDLSHYFPTVKEDIWVSRVDEFLGAIQELVVSIDK